MTIGVGIVGMGFMGRRHAINVVRMAHEGGACRLVAVHSEGVRTIEDLVESGRGGNIGGGDDAHERVEVVDIAGSYDELLSRVDVDCVVVCTPTPTHVELAEQALRAGRHVLIEKPVALTAKGMARLMAVHADHNELVCMPAHVIRFWPGWTDVKDAIADERYGSVRSATFRRLGSMPEWNRAFYSDLEASGGALVDLHLHDVDFILHCFGEPDQVHASGDLLHVTGGYEYIEGPAHVIAEGAWDQQPGIGFRMQCIVNFERATMEFDSTKDPPLIVFEGDLEKAVEASRGDGYGAEMRAFLGAVRGEHAVPVTLDDALRAARVIDQERMCLERKENEE